MRLTIRERALPSLRKGHPWVFREAIVQKGGTPPALGDSVTLCDEQGRVLGRGIADPGSPIAVRIYASGDGPPIDSAFIAQRIEQALSRRDDMFDPERTTQLRLLNGEGDRVGGLVIDRYAHVAVLRSDGAAIAVHVPKIVERVWPLLKKRGVETFLMRDPDARDGADKTSLLKGVAAPERVSTLEHGMQMEVDVLHGQKTGAFLDQRENRLRVRQLARGRVLNLFSYTGGFSLAAALGGATEVTSVDIAAQAHQGAQRMFKANGVDLKPHRFVTADALRFVDDEAKRKNQYDLIISDPPSFARSEKQVERALGSYAKLHRACAALLAPGGTFCASSCSSHVSMERFMLTLDDASLGRSDLVTVGLHGPPEDHPTPACFGEGRYLKFVLMR